MLLAADLAVKISSERDVTGLRAGRARDRAGGAEEGAEVERADCERIASTLRLRIGFGMPSSVAHIDCEICNIFFHFHPDPMHNQTLLNEFSQMKYAHSINPPSLRSSTIAPKTRTKRGCNPRLVPNSKALHLSVRNVVVLVVPAIFSSVSPPPAILMIMGTYKRVYYNQHPIHHSKQKIDRQIGTHLVSITPRKVLAPDIQVGILRPLLERRHVLLMLDVLVVEDLGVPAGGGEGDWDDAGGCQ